MKHFVVNASTLEPAASAEEADWIFGPMDNGEEIVFSDATDMEALAAEAGIFPSKSQARKNGFSGPIPFGVNFFGTKKPGKRFWVWNLTQGGEPTIRKNFNHTNRWFGI